MYTWAGATNNEAFNETNPLNVQGVCPTGWHLPNGNDWNELSDFLGGIYVAGGKMKEAGVLHWGSEFGTNKSGFTAIPVTYRHIDGSFVPAAKSYWWSSIHAPWNTTLAGWVACQGDGYFVYIADLATYKMSGFSVRCIKDN